MVFPNLAYGTPRKLPKAKSLPGRVVVLDIAFASTAGGASFEKVTLPFIEGLGDRLAMWVDHHDHERHAHYRQDPRFVLRTKAEAPACPELVTPAIVEAAGPVDTICCHGDFDGLCAAAKWIRGGEEPYPGADADARAIDTRLGKPSELGQLLDRALRGRPRDDGLKGLLVRFLVEGARDAGMREIFESAGRELARHEEETLRIAKGYEIEGSLAVCDATSRNGFYDKTMLLLLGQERAKVAVVHDETTVTIAARFDSGVNLLEIFGLEGGMPTRVSVAKKDLPRVLEELRARFG
ncbi:MAG: hypothetical protein GXY23_12790 [Myxococcales bacterium]|nr:hypothetical protein [Myxococcales bacterium]